MSSKNRSPLARILTHRRPARSRWARSLTALSLLTLLGGTVTACEDLGDDDAGRRGRFGWDDDRWERGGRDRDGWRRWHRPHRGDAADASADGAAGNAATDAGDGGPATNAGTADAAAQPVGEDLLDAGAADAATVSAVAALSDGQLLLVADNLLAGAIAQAQAALPRLSNPDAVGFAEQLIDENAATRQTLAVVGDAIAATPAPSAEADAVTAESDALAAAFGGPDAGALDALYIDSTVTAHAAAGALAAELAASADAPVLRAQLVVLQTVLATQLTRAQTIADTL